MTAFDMLRERRQEPEATRLDTEASALPWKADDGDLLAVLKRIAVALEEIAEKGRAV